MQRASQRALLANATCFLDNEPFKIYLREISQVYVKSTSKLNRGFYIHPQDLNCPVARSTESRCHCTEYPQEELIDTTRNYHTHH